MNRWARLLLVGTLLTTAVLGQAAGASAAPAPTAVPGPLAAGGPDGALPPSVTAPGRRGPVGPGGSDTDVVGGTTAARGEFPWIVRLMPMGCGGAMYTPTLVLTAAHCFDHTGPSAPVTVTWGVTDLEDPAATMRSSDRVVLAPGYSGLGVGTATTSRRDWALVRLSSPITSAPLLPIATDTSLHTGSLTIAGWGSTSAGGLQQRHLRKASVPFVSDATCQGYGAAYARIIPSQEICAGHARGGVDTCQGDSGGPAVRRNGHGDWVQVGITSWGIGCALPRSPGVYTEVRRFAADIRSAAAALGGAPATNPYTARGVCGSSYTTTVTSRDLGGHARTYLLYSPTTGKNCVVTVKKSKIGVASPVAARLTVSGQAQVEDAGSFTYYAGPVRRSARDTCVRYGGSYGSTSWTSGWIACR